MLKAVVKLAPRLPRWKTLRWQLDEPQKRRRRSEKRKKLLRWSCWSCTRSRSRRACTAPPLLTSARLRYGI